MSEVERPVSLWSKVVVIVVLSPLLAVFFIAIGVVIVVEHVWNVFLAVVDDFAESKVGTWLEQKITGESE